MCPVLYQSVHESARQDSVERLAKGTINNIYYSPSSTELVISTQKFIRLVKEDLPFTNPCWLFPAMSLSFVCFRSGLWKALTSLPCTCGCTPSSPMHLSILNFFKCSLTCSPFTEAKPSLLQTSLLVLGTLDSQRLVLSGDIEVNKVSRTSSMSFLTKKM